MSRYIDQKAADSAPASEPVDQAMDLRITKLGDVTHVTLMGDARAVMPGFGTKDLDFFHGLLHQVSNAGSKGKYPDEIRNQIHARVHQGK